MILDGSQQVTPSDGPSDPPRLLFHCARGYQNHTKLSECHQYASYASPIINPIRLPTETGVPKAVLLRADMAFQGSLTNSTSFTPDLLFGKRRKDGFSLATILVGRRETKKRLRRRTGVLRVRVRSLLRSTVWGLRAVLSNLPLEGSDVTILNASYTTSQNVRDQPLLDLTGSSHAYLFIFPLPIPDRKSVV